MLYLPTISNPSSFVTGLRSVLLIVLSLLGTSSAFGSVVGAPSSVALLSVSPALLVAFVSPDELLISPQHQSQTALPSRTAQADKHRSISTPIDLTTTITPPDILQPTTTATFTTIITSNADNPLCPDRHATEVTVCPSSSSACDDIECSCSIESPDEKQREDARMNHIEPLGEAEESYLIDPATTKEIELILTSTSSERKQPPSLGKEMIQEDGDPGNKEADKGPASLRNLQMLGGRPLVGVPFMARGMQWIPPAVSQWIPPALTNQIMGGQYNTNLYPNLVSSLRPLGLLGVTNSLMRPLPGIL